MGNTVCRLQRVKLGVKSGSSVIIKEKIPHQYFYKALLLGHALSFNYKKIDQSTPLVVYSVVIKWACTPLVPTVHALLCCYVSF